MHEQMETGSVPSIADKADNTPAVTLHGFLQGEDSVVPLPLLCFVEPRTQTQILGKCSPIEMHH